MKGEVGRGFLMRAKHGEAVMGDGFGVETAIFAAAAVAMIAFAGSFYGVVAA